MAVDITRSREWQRMGVALARRKAKRGHHTCLNVSSWALSCVSDASREAAAMVRHAVSRPAIQLPTELQPTAFSLHRSSHVVKRAPASSVLPRISTRRSRTNRDMSPAIENARGKSELTLPSHWQRGARWRVHSSAGAFFMCRCPAPFDERGAVPCHVMPCSRMPCGAIVPLHQ